MLGAVGAARGWPGCSRPSGAVVAFGGFTLVRDGERLRIRRGLVSSAARRRCRSAACARCGWSRASAAPVRARGADRRGHGLRRARPPRRARCSRSCACATCAAFLDEFLPELADDPAALERPPARAARRYVAAGRCWSARPSAVGRVVPRRAVRAARAAARGAVRPRALARRGLAAARRPAGGALDAARAHDRARPGALPRVAHGGAERLPAPRRARRPSGRVRQADHGARPPPRRRGRSPREHARGRSPVQVDAGGQTGSTPLLR